MKNVVLAVALAVSGVVTGQESLHDTILEQPYRNDTITEVLFDAETINTIMIELINEYRVENGVEPLIVDTTLMRLANNHAKWMAETRIYVHLNNEKTPNHDDHKKYNFSENIMRYNTIQWDTHFTMAKSVFGAWIGSSSLFGKFSKRSVRLHPLRLWGEPNLCIHGCRGRIGLSRARAGGEPILPPAAKFVLVSWPVSRARGG